MVTSKPHQKPIIVYCILQEKQEILEQYQTRINDIFSEECIRFNVERHLPNFFLINNMVDDPEITNIWKGIVNCVQYQSQWEKEIPARWLALERDMLNKKSEGLNTLTFQQICQIGKALEMPIEDQEEVTLFLQHQSTNGSILYMPQGEMPAQQDVVINIQWIIDAFKCIISFDKKLISSEYPDSLDVELQQKIRREGIFTRENVKTLWSNEQFKHKEDVLLAFLKYLNLIALPSEEAETFYIPCLFKDKTPDEIRERIYRKPTTTVSKTLCLDYRRSRSTMPPTLFDRILAAFIDKYHFLLHKDSVPFYGRGIALCKVDQDHSALIVCKDDVIKVTLLTSLPAVKVGIGRTIRTFLTSTIPRKARMLGQNTHVVKVGIDDNPIPQKDQTYFMINDSAIGLDLHFIPLEEKSVWDLEVKNF